MHPSAEAQLESSVGGWTVYLDASWSQQSSSKVPSDAIVCIQDSCFCRREVLAFEPRLEIVSCLPELLVEALQAGDCP